MAQGRDRFVTGGDLPVDQFDDVLTAATGTDYTPLPGHERARMVRIMNPSVDIEVRQVGGTKAVIAPAFAETPIYVARNSNELEVRRLDTSNTQVAVGLAIGVY